MAERAPGFEDFTPSRLEWLAFALNSLSPYLDTPFECPSCPIIKLTLLYCPFTK